MDWRVEAESTRALGPRGESKSMVGRIYELVKNAGDIFIDKKAPSRGAAIAFYAVTSIAPVLLIVIAIAGAVFGGDAARGAIFAQFRGLIGTEGADLLQNIIASAGSQGGSFWASIIGIVTLILTASGVFLELEDALNEMWEVKHEGGMLTGMVRARLASLGLVMGLGFLLLVSLVVDAGLKGLSETINARWPFGAPLLMALSFVVSLALIAVLFAAIYKLLPAKPLAWPYVIFGAVVTAVVFQIGKFVIGLYLGSTGASSTLGAAGALLGLLFWVYYSAQIFLFGAALTKAHYDHSHAMRERKPSIMP